MSKYLPIFKETGFFNNPAHQQEYPTMWLPTKECKDSPGANTTVLLVQDTAAFEVDVKLLRDTP